MKNRTATYRSFLRCVFAAAGLLAAQSVSYATSLNFDEIPDGTVIDTRYPGVTFSTLEGSIYAKSNYLAPSSPNGISDNPNLSYVLGGLGGGVRARFAAPVREVRIDTRPYADMSNGFHFPFSGRPYMRVYNTAAQLLGTVYYAGALPTAEVPGVATETLTFISTSANISLVEFSKEDYAPYRGAIFDNLRFGNLQTGPTFVVNTADDHDDGAATEVDCTLREAINAANASGAVTPTITFEPWVTGTIALQLGELAINHDVTIVGPGAKILAVSGNYSSRVFKVTAGFVEVSGLKVTNGRVIGAAGNTGSTSSANGQIGGEGSGGAMHNQGVLTLSECWITGNNATGGSGGLGAPNSSGNLPPGVGGSGGGGYGGGIYNVGDLRLNGCTIDGNTTIGGSGGKGGDAASGLIGNGGLGGTGGVGAGGAVYTVGGLNAGNCTISGNSASGGRGGVGGEGQLVFGGGASGGRGGDGGTGKAGGIANLNGQLIASCTVTSNTASAGLGGLGGARPIAGGNGAPGSGLGGGLVSGNIFSTVQNSLVAGNNSPVGPDASGPFYSQGNNLVGIVDGATGFVKSGDQTGSSGSPLNPVLGPLADYGGETPTHLLLAGSPAIDKGSLGLILPIDQRGRARPFDLPDVPNNAASDGSDIGAVEVEYLAVPIVGLFNTGVDQLGQPKSDNNSESHYLIARHPFPGVVPFVATSMGGFPIPPWLGDNAMSAWISPTVNTDQPPSSDNGTIYEINFDLTGLDHTRAQISGRWAADNSGAVLLNGANTGLTVVGFDAFTPFKITTLFSPGINTLQFRVYNAGTSPNPSGVRVELSGIARLDLRASVVHSGGIATITWVSQPGRTYRVQWKVQLTDPVWNDLTPDVVATSGTSFKTDNVGAGQRRMYRVLLLP